MKSSFFVFSETSNKALVPVFLVYGFTAAFRTSHVGDFLNTVLQYGWIWMLEPGGAIMSRAFVDCSTRALQQECHSYLVTVGH